MNIYPYTNCKRNIGLKVDNLATDTLKVLLMGTGYTPNMDTDSAYSMSAPAAPTVNATGTGNTVPAGTYGVLVAFTNPAGETVTSSATTVTVTSGQQIVITSPSAPSPADSYTGYYAYVTQAGGSTYYRQQTVGSPTPIGTNLNLTANPTTTGATATPGARASGANPADVVSNEVANGNGYTTGGQTLTSVGWTEILANSFSRSWAASTAYTLGQIVRPATGNGYLYECVQNGSTGASAPTWGTTIGGITTDGTTTWLCIGSSIMVLSASNVAWSVTAAITWRYGVVYDVTTGDLVCYIDPGSTQTGPTTGSINLNWDSAAGILNY